MRKRAENNQDGLERTLRALTRAKRLTPDSEALVALCRALAKAVDSEPTVCNQCKGATYNAALWREYRAAVADLHTAGAATDDADDDTRGFLASLQTPSVVRAPVGHPADN